MPEHAVLVRVEKSQTDSALSIRSTWVWPLEGEQDLMSGMISVWDFPGTRQEYDESIASICSATGWVPDGDVLYEHPGFKNLERTHLMN